MQILVNKNYNDCYKLHNGDDYFNVYNYRGTCLVTKCKTFRGMQLF